MVIHIRLFYDDDDFLNQHKRNITTIIMLYKINNLLNILGNAKTFPPLQ